MTRGALTILLTFALLSAGCIGLGGEDVDATGAGNETGIAVSDETQRQIQERTAKLPRNYTVPGQSLVTSTVHWINGTVGSQANVAHESKNDRAGNDVNTYVIAEDVSKFLPPGQPAEVRAKLHYQGQLGSTADLDLYVKVPGLETDYAPDNADEWNWKDTVQTLTVNTVGVEGQTPMIGVQVTNGKLLSGMDYTIRVEFHYVRDVLTPYHPYAFDVPENASGVILESVKVAGDEHINATFLVIDPDDELVRVVEYNDLAIASESIFIPLRKSGEHVFYASKMRGGFLSIKADAPVPDDARSIRILPRTEERVADITGPAPGMVAYNPTKGCAQTLLVVGVNCDTGESTPFQPGAEATFTVEGTFPLEVLGYVTSESTFTGGTQVRISSSKGIVYDYKRIARADGSYGTLGSTRDEINTEVHPENLVKGTYMIEIVNDGSPEVGHIILTYER